jgi:antitoxin YefM
MQETMHLLGIPGMRESIRLGMETPLEECGDEPGW